MAAGLAGILVIGAAAKSGGSSPFGSGGGSGSGSGSLPQVTGLKVSVQGNVAALTWAPVTNATSYQVRPVVNGQQQQPTTVQSASATVKQLPFASKVGFQVRACTGGTGSMAQVCGPWSSVETITVGAPSAPPEVSGIQISGSGTSRTVSWSALSKPAGVQSVSYTIEHTDASGNPIQSGQQGYASFNGGQGNMTTSATSVTISGLQYGYTLHVRIRACYNY